tara:strand:+ start:123 stop:818 length:696 start_codon:yes stop_codon:yes gene_type:complete
MTTDRVFVLLMMVLLMMAGCFEATSTTEAEEEQDSTSGDDDSTDSSTPNSGNTATNSQQRVWYSSGNGIITNWNDGQDTYSQQRCLEYGPSYDSNTGEYIGEECKRSGYPQSEQDWNSSSCDGVLTPLNGWYSTACKSTVKTINTNPGEALLIYELHEASVTTICNGITASTITYANILNLDKEYRIAAGSALSCVHELTYTQYYSSLSDYDPNEMEIWSIVYAIQDTVVV